MDTILKYIDDLAHKNSEALSFIPMSKLEQYAEAGQILVQYENDDPCGFLIYGLGWPTMKVYQECIQYDARRRKNGLELISKLIAAAESRKCSRIVLWCADDLPANEFWRAAGFCFAGQRDGGSRRGRKHNLWRMELSLFRGAA